jgi:hypothetical protein
MTALRLLPKVAPRTTTEDSRHWCPQSQKYAPGDVLLSHVRNGWTLDPVVGVECFYYSGYRCVEVFHFVLTAGDQVLKMPVIANPKIHQLIEEYQLTSFHIKSTEMYS